MLVLPSLLRSIVRRSFRVLLLRNLTPKIRIWMQTILCYSIRKMKQTLRSLLSIREQYGVAGWDTSVVLNGAVLLGLSLARCYQWISIYIVLRCRLCVFQVFSWALQRCRTGLYSICTSVHNLRFEFEFTY